MAVAALSWPAGLLHAGDVYGDKDGPKQEPLVLPKPADVQTFTVYPEKIALQNGDDAQQLIVTAGLAGGRLQDLTGDVQVHRRRREGRPRHADRPRPAGRPTAPPTIKAVYGDKTLTIPVTAANCDVNLPINFGNQIVPIFTKLGCNSGGCHGKASGQNGFKISLLGFDPEVDYNALVKEARGRRVFPASPGQQPAAAQGVRRHRPRRRQAHGGRLRRVPPHPPLDRGRHALRQADRPGGRRSVTVYPDHRIMTRNNKQQFAVYAHYSDGSVEDVTRRAQYESNDQEIAAVDAAGLVRTLADERRGRRHGPLPVARHRLPRHRAAGRADPRLRLRAEDRGGSVHGQTSGRNSALCPPICARTTSSSAGCRST